MEKYITVQHSLNKRELEIIMDNMSKADDTDMGYPRYLDLDNLIKQVEAAKDKNPGKQLKTVILTHQRESCPPHNTYSVIFH